MKVLVINTVPFLNNGMSAIILNYYRQLKKDFKFYFVVNHFIEDYFFNYLQEGAEVSILPNRKKTPIKYMIALRKIIRYNDFEIIHIHGNSSLMAMELLALSKVTKAKVIVHCHGSESKYEKIEKFTRNYFYKNYDKALTVELDKSFLFEGKEHEVIPNGIDVRKFQFSEQSRFTIRNTLHLRQETVLIHVGRMNYQKNHFFLLKVFGEYLKLDASAKLILVGDGKFRDEIEATLQEMNILDSVVFTGNVTNVFEYYSAADVFLLPSTFEPFGLVAIEAQANGLPCIFSEKVSSCVKVSESIQYLGINEEDILNWVSEILKYSFMRKEGKHNNPTKNIAQYDIINSSYRLKQIYLDLTQNK